MSNPGTSAGTFGRTRWAPPNWGRRGKALEYFCILTRSFILAFLIVADTRLIPAQSSSDVTNAPPKRVLILDSFGRGAAPYAAAITALRTALAKEFGEPVDIYDELLQMDRFADPDAESAQADFLARRFGQRHLDLVIPVGAPAVVFAANHKERLFPDTPMVLTGVERRRLQPQILTQQTTLVTQDADLPGIIRNILQVLPGTTNVVVVTGTTPLEKFWMNEIQKEAAPFASRAKLSWLTDYSLPEIAQRVSRLPPRTVIFLPMLVVDGAGVPYAQRAALERLRELANAPIFGFFQSQFGRGIVGGRLYEDETIGEAAARTAVRILKGESPANIPQNILPASAPRYDWRELQRWNIDTKRLPEGSEVEFRQPPRWETYRKEIIVVLVILVAQSLLIAALLRQGRQQERTQQILDERLQIEQLISELSHVLINAPSDGLAGQIVNSLRKVGESLNFDLAAFSIFTGRGNEGKVAFLWRAEGVPEFTTRLIEQDFPWSASQLVQDRDVWLPTLASLPKEAAVDRASYEKYGIRSSYHVPLYTRGSILASLNLCTVREVRKLPRELSPRQRLIGEVFAGALSRKLSEDRQRESDTRFRIVADSTPVLIWMSGTDKLCTFFNKAWLDFTGRSLEQEIGEGWAQGVHPGDVSRCLATYSNSFDQRKPFEMEYRLRRNDGEYRWVADYGVPRYDGGKDFAGYIGTCIDLTDRRRAETETQQQRAELAHISRLTTMGELTASLAHELNHPQTAILSNAQAGELFLNQDPPAMDEVKKILGDIVRDNRRAVEIIQRLRAFLKKRDLEFERVDINGIVQETVPLVEADAGNRGIVLKLALDPTLAGVRADRVHLQQVLLNLMINAMDAMNQPGNGKRELHVLTRPFGNNGESMVEVAVKDSGSGIPEHKLRDIFQPFFTTKPHGMGMGLSISRTIIEAHGGRIAAENNAEAGATIRFTLQVWKEKS